MKVAVGQFAVTPDAQQNAQTCVKLMANAASQNAALLVLPEALLARSDSDPDMSVKSAQPLNGDYVQRLREESARNRLTTLLTIHTPTREGRAANTLIALRGGEIIAQYQKIHLYDAFAMQESRLVDAGSALPPLIEVEGMKVGLMTCYDLRFPEMALSLALAGAEIWRSRPRGCAGRSKSITGPRCSRHVRWTPPAIWWRAASAATVILVRAASWIRLA